MKSSNNNIFIFLNDKNDISKASEILEKKYPIEKNNIIEAVHELSDAMKMLGEYSKKRVSFDIIMVDLKFPINIRKEFIEIVNRYQKSYECIIVANNCQLKPGDKSFIRKSNTFLIPFIDEIAILPLFENIIEKKFNEKKHNLIKEIDSIVNLKSESQQILKGIAKVALEFLGLKICSINLVDYQRKKLKIGAISGMGEYEKEFREEFDISLSDKAVLTECIKKKKQIQYENVLDDNCPFKYKEFAKKMGLKSILVTPIYDRRGTGPKKVAATLNVYTKFNHKFQIDEMELAKKIAAKTNIVLSQKGMFDEEKEERQKEIGLIEKVAAEINKNVSDYKKVFKTIVDEGINLVQAHRGCIKLYDKAINYISREYPQYCENLPYKNERLREPDITSYVIKKQKPVNIPDIHKCIFKDPKLKYVNYGSRISVPLWSKGQVIGVLTAEHNEKNHFDKNQLQLFEALAIHAVIAIENTNRYKKLEKRLHSQLVIKNLTQETSKLKAMDDEKERKKYRKGKWDVIIRRAIEGTVRIFDAQSGFVALAEFKSNFAKRNPKWQFKLENLDFPPLEIGVVKKGKLTFKGEKCITGKVIAEGELYNSGNVKHDPFYLKQQKNDKTVSAIIVPLKFQEQTIGAFGLNSNKENAFSSEDEEILESIAVQMALLIKRFHYLNALTDLIKPFKNIDKLEQLYDEIRDRTLDSLDTGVCYLRILDRNEFRIKSYKGITDFQIVQSLKKGEGVSGKVAETLKPQIIKDVQKEFHYKYKGFAKENNLFAMMAVPVISNRPDGKRELIGVLNSYANRICNFSPLDLQLMLLIAEKAGEAIKKAKLIKQLDEIAWVDMKLTTTSEKTVLQDIAKVAKNLLDADQVVLFQYNSNIVENSGFSTPATISGKSILCEKAKSQAKFTKDSFVVLLLGEESNEYFIESYENNDLIKRIYKNRAKSGSPKRFYEREQLKSVIILKLTYKKEVVGIAFINYRYQKSFSSEDKRIAKTFANKAAIAISNIRKYEDIDRLHSVGNVIASEPNLDKVLEKIALNAKATLGADIVIVHRYDKITKKALHPPIQSGNIYHPYAIKGKYGETNVISNLIEKSKDVFAIDAKIDELFRSGDDWKSGTSKVPRFTEREKIESCAAMLLKVRNEIVGVMFINYRTVQKFDTQQKRIIKIFANQAAIAIRNANLIKEGKQTIERISVNLTAIQKSGYKIVKKLNKAQVSEQVSEQDILQPILSKALKLIDVNMGYIGLVNKKKRNTQIMVCSGKYIELLNKSINIYYPDKDWIRRKERFDIFPDDKVKGDKIKSDYKRFAENDQLIYGYHFEADRDVQSALRVPIYSDKELLGMVILESEKLNAFSKIDAYAVMSLANQASMALQNYRLIQQLRKLREVDLAILKEQYNLDKVLEVILKAALDLVKKKYADIKLIMDNGDLIIKKSIPRSAEGKIIGVSDCLSGIAVEKNKTYYEKDVSRNPRFLKTEGVKAKSELVIPLKVDKRPTGVLNIESEELEDFTKEDINILEMLARQASIAIHNAQLFENINKRRKELNALREIDIAILDSELDLSDTLNYILTKGLQLIDAKHGAIILHDENKQKLVVVKSTYPVDEGLILAIDDSVCGLAFKRGETICKRDIDNDPLYQIVFGGSMKSELVVPLKVSDKVIGLINIESEKPQRFNEDEIVLLENLSGGAAIAIYLAQQKDKLIEKEKEASIGTITRESVHWIGNKIGPISRSTTRIKEDLKRLYTKNIIEEKIHIRLMENLELIEKGANSSLSIKSDLIDVGKKKETFDLIQLLNSCLDNFKKEYLETEIINAEKIPIKYQIKTNLKTKFFQIEYDKSHLERVFHYILKNAYQAIEDMIDSMQTLLNFQEDNFAGKIFVKAYKNASHLIIEFEDNGIGIKKENEAELFRPFYTTKGADRGSGVGLYFCRRTMEELGGKIHLKKAKGKETVFCLEFPKKI